MQDSIMFISSTSGLYSYYKNLDITHIIKLLIFFSSISDLNYLLNSQRLEVYSTDGFIV